MRRVLLPSAVIVAVAAVATLGLMRPWDEAGQAPRTSPTSQVVAGPAAPTLEGTARTDDPAHAAAHTAATNAAQPAPNAARTAGARICVRLPGAEPAPAGVRVQVRLEDDQTATPRTFRTGPDGCVDAGGFSPGDYVVMVVLDGFVPGQAYWTAQAPSARNGPVESEAIRIDLQAGVPLDGRVVDGDTGASIAGASVAIDDWPSLHEIGPTPEEGTFRIPGIVPGETCWLQVRAPGYVPAELEIPADRTPTDPRRHRVRLRPGAAIQGRVTTPEGTPVAGARVVVKPDDWSQPDRRPLAERMLDWDEDPSDGEYEIADVLFATTAVDGTYRVEGVGTVRAWSVRASAAGHGSAHAGPITLETTGRTANADLMLPPEAGAHVTILAPAGAALPAEIRVRIIDPYTMHAPTTEQGHAGRFDFEALDAGPAYVFVDAPGYRPTALPLELAAGQVARLEVPLDEGQIVSGVVLGAGAKPVRGAEVLAAPAAANPQVDEGDAYHLEAERKTTTDAEGHFEIRGLPAGPTLILARHEYRTWTTPAPVRCSAPAEGVTVRLQRRGCVSLRLLLPSGRPFTDPVTIFTEEPDGTVFGSGYPPPSEDGRVERGPFRDGRGTLIVVPKGHAWFARGFEIKGGADVHLGDVCLTTGVTVTGRVIDDLGRPVANGRIDAGDHSVAEAWTGEDGRFEIPHCPDTALELQAWKDDVSTYAYVEPEGATNVEIVLPRAAHLRAVVRRADGSPPKDSEFRLRPPGAKKHPQTIQRHGGGAETRTWWWEGEEWLDIDGMGRYEGPMRPGRYEVWWVDGEGQQRKVGACELLPGGEHDLEITLPAR